MFVRYRRRLLLVGYVSAATEENGRHHWQAVVQAVRQAEYKKCSRAGELFIDASRFAVAIGFHRREGVRRQALPRRNQER